MSSPAQIAANRTNAASSTGPATAEGKAISSQNATRHGLRSASVLIAGENPADYEALKDDLIYHFAPKTPAESAYVDIIAVSTWRLQRIAGIEASIYARCESAGDAFLKYTKELMNLARYQNTIQRGADRAKKELLELQKTRLYNEQNGFVRQKQQTATPKPQQPPPPPLPKPKPEPQTPPKRLFVDCKTGRVTDVTPPKP